MIFVLSITDTYHNSSLLMESIRTYVRVVKRTTQKSLAQLEQDS
nr:MAG TPA: hypothetical protein [Caudoviricetes sp.]